MNNPIGGYPAWELPLGKADYYPGAHQFQSARAAFLALLLSGRPNRLWVPWYVCDSMLESAAMAGIPLSRYALDEALAIEESLILEPGDWLLYVNYFGICDSNVARMLDRFPRNQVIIDNAQAFFSPPQDCLATIYSPRKFFGVPDGGYLFTSLPIEMPSEEDSDSIQRCTHLLKRLAFGAEAGYADYRNAEDGFRQQQPKRMSRLTRQLLASIDYADARARRAENAGELHVRFQSVNTLKLVLAAESPPLCYPLLLPGNDVRNKLISQRIFIPAYWPEIQSDLGVPEYEKMLARSCLFLPCDQRISKEERNTLLTAVLECIGEQ